MCGTVHMNINNNKNFWSKTSPSLLSEPLEPYPASTSTLSKAFYCSCRPCSGSWCLWLILQPLAEHLCYLYRPLLHHLQPLRLLSLQISSALYLHPFQPPALIHATYSDQIYIIYSLSHLLQPSISTATIIYMLLIWPTSTTISVGVSCVAVVALYCQIQIRLCFLLLLLVLLLPNAEYIVVAIYLHLSPYATHFLLVLESSSPLFFWSKMMIWPTPVWFVPIFSLSAL